MDLKQIEVFNKVCESKSFSEAAKELYVTQPTVSSHIKSLEDKLEVQLFRRKDKSQGTLTDAGRLLYSYTSQIFSLIKEAESTISNYKEGLNGNLSIATSYTVLNSFLPNLLKKYKEKFLSVELILHSGVTDNVIKMVSNREVQFGFIRNATPSLIDPTFVTECISSDQSIFICAPNHKLARLKEVRTKDINQVPIIRIGKGTGYWNQVSRMFQSNNVQPKVTMELNDIFAVKKMTELGLGISFVPQMAVQEDLNKGNLFKLNITDLPPVKRYSLLIYRKDLILTGPNQSFIELVNKYKSFLA